MLSLGSTPHMYIHNPSPTTVQYTFSTRRHPSTRSSLKRFVSAIGKLLRVVIGITIIVLLAAKYLQYIFDGRDCAISIIQARSYVISSDVGTGCKSKTGFSTMGGTLGYGLAVAMGAMPLGAGRLALWFVSPVDWRVLVAAAVVGGWTVVRRGYTGMNISAALDWRQTL
jgi:hypothetical protein